MTKFLDSFSEEIWASTYKHHTDTDINATQLRVATAIASVEETEEKRAEWTEKFYDMLSDFKVVPGGRIMVNAGTEWHGSTLVNCFVGPEVENDPDSIDGIYEALVEQAKTLKSEGGWGHNFSALRPRGSFIHGVGVESPGAVKFMELFDKSSEIVTQGSGLAKSNKKGKTKIRKGAMMGVMDVWHPDIIEFITAKQTPGRLQKFNVSVNCVDAFMQKLNDVERLKNEGASEEEIKAADEWILRFPDTTHADYKKSWKGDLKKWEAAGLPTVEYQKVSATWLWNLITESTYNRAEPGVLFLDRANYGNPFHYGETIYATNPCGEQTLSPGNVCVLGSLNLSQFVIEETRTLDFDRIKEYAARLVRFLDNVDSYSPAPLPEYKFNMMNKRRVGCGVMGWGSALFMMKIRFGSDEAIELQQKLMKIFSHACYTASVDLAEEKGMFPLCIPEQHATSPFVQSLGLPAETIERMKKVGIRNSTIMSVQPTGNSSILANLVSGGIEPVFMPEYIRTAIMPSVPEEIADRTPKYFQGEFFETELFKFAKEGDDEILKAVLPDGTVYKIDRNRGLTREVLCQDYGVRWLAERGEWDATADWAVTTTQLTVDDHIRDLQGFARWIDSAISKTINVPNDMPYDAFQQVYRDTYNTGFIKGVTTYRAGTMAAVLSAKEEKFVEEEEVILDSVKLPDSAPAHMKTLKAEGRKWYLTVIMDEQNKRPMALFVHTNHAEKNVTTNNTLDVLFGLAEEKGIPTVHITDVKEKIVHDTNATKIARAISLLLRHGVLIRNIVAALDTVEDVFVGTFVFQIKKFLSSYIKDGEPVAGAKCESCGSTNITYSEGCMKCSDCGSSKCG